MFATKKQTNKYDVTDPLLLNGFKVPAPYEIMTLKITLKIHSNAEKPGNKRNE